MARPIPLPVRPDNIHWVPDGRLLVAGHTDEASDLLEIDPATLQVTELFDRPDTPTFRRFTGAAEVGSEFWIGSSRSPYIAIYPSPLPREAEGHDTIREKSR